MNSYVSIKKQGGNQTTDSFCQDNFFLKKQRNIIMMTNNFQANALPVLIGSLPINDHKQAIKLVLQYTPEIPLWVQLPIHREEGMIAQFMHGLPSLSFEKDNIFINTNDDNFNDDFVKFYEDYLAVIEGQTDILNSKFVLTQDNAMGFFVFMQHIENLAHSPIAVKGQITGPVTFGIGMKDQNGRSVFYDEQMRDVIVKLIALKARWQVKQLSKFGCPAIVFFDEPALAGLGSSAFISISNDNVSKCFKEVIEAVHFEGGLAGIHVCANSDWPIILESGADIVSFDSYSYFDRFILYSEHIKKFIELGRILAWGIVPTSQDGAIEKETADSLTNKWKEQAQQIESLGIDREQIIAQSLITPSCGTGSLSFEHTIKVLKLTKEVSNNLQN